MGHNPEPWYCSKGCQTAWQVRPQPAQEKRVKEVEIEHTRTPQQNRTDITLPKLLHQQTRDLQAVQHRTGEEDPLLSLPGLGNIAAKSQKNTCLESVANPNQYHIVCPRYTNRQEVSNLIVEIATMSQEMMCLANSHQIEMRVPPLVITLRYWGRTNLHLCDKRGLDAVGSQTAGTDP